MKKANGDDGEALSNEGNSMQPRPVEEYYL